MDDSGFQTTRPGYEAPGNSKVETGLPQNQYRKITIFWTININLICKGIDSRIGWIFVSIG